MGRHGAIVSLINTPEFSLFILLVILIVGPLVAARLRIPTLIGLIAGGILVGPFGLNWIRYNSLLSDFGDLGILFLMFLAGISFNLRAFFANRANSITYGLLGFGIPFGLSIAVVLGLSEAGILGAMLVGAMWASNTLVAYPEVVSAGLQDNRAVTASVSAGVVADLLSLTVLAIATSTAVIEADSDPTTRAVNAAGELPIWIGIALLAFATLWLLPRIASWFFVKIGHSRVQRFLFAIAAMTGAAVLADVGGLEGLIGAFLAGLGLNKLVPAESELMGRLDFVGGTLFVPAFLVSIGLSIDPKVLFDGETLLLALLFTVLVVVGKGVAAAITGAIFRVTGAEIGLMASLSMGQAASTLAIAQVGFTLGFFGQVTVNASVLTIVACAFITSIGTKAFARRVERPAHVESILGRRVLVDATGTDEEMTAGLTVGGSIARPDDGVVVPILVPGSGGLEGATNRMEKAEAVAAALGHDSTGVSRIDEGFASGVLHLIEEQNASMVVLRWDGPDLIRNVVFGSVIDDIGARCAVPSLALRIESEWSRVVVVTGSTTIDWHAEDASMAIAVGERLARSQGKPLVVITTEQAFVDRHDVDLDSLSVIVVRRLNTKVLEVIETDDLVITPAHVARTVSSVWNRRMPRILPAKNLGVVAGPYRLSVTDVGPVRAQNSLIGPATDLSN